VLEDTCSEPLDGMLGAPIEVRSFAPRQLGRCGPRPDAQARVNKDIEPANILSRIVLAYQSCSLLV
jgi:hypothetical protein